MKLSKAQAAALQAVESGGHISYDRFTRKYITVHKTGEKRFITREALDKLHAAGLLREADLRYEPGTHRVTDAGRTALRERER